MPLSFLPSSYFSSFSSTTKTTTINTIGVLANTVSHPFTTPLSAHSHNKQLPYTNEWPCYALLNNLSKLSPASYSFCPLTSTLPSPTASGRSPTCYLSLLVRLFTLPHVSYLKVVADGAVLGVTPDMYFLSSKFRLY